MPVLLAARAPAEKTFREAEVAPKVKKIILDVLDVEESKVIDSARLSKDLGADSLDCVEIVLELEDTFLIEIPDAAAEKFERVSDLIQYVKKALAAQKRLS